MLIILISSLEDNMSNLKKITLLVSGFIGLFSLAIIAIAIVYSLSNNKPIDYGTAWPLLIPLVLSTGVFLWGYFFIEE
jgi:hypothetical protein